MICSSLLRWRERFVLRFKLKSCLDALIFLLFCICIYRILLSLRIVVFLMILSYILPLPKSHSVKKPKTNPVTAKRINIRRERFWISCNLF